MNDYLLNSQSIWPPSALNIKPDITDYTVSIPISLAKSLEGKYFVGVSNTLEFGNASNAWARLYNPDNSGVNLHVNVWTLTDVFSTPYKAQVWFNSTPPGFLQDSYFVTSSNTAILPVPQPKVQLQYAIAVKGMPSGGIHAFSRSGLPGINIISEEEGKFIFPPGGSFLVFLSNPERPTQPATGLISFGWWEEPII